MKGQVMGLLNPATLPVVGVDSARKALDPSLPSNTLMSRADRKECPVAMRSYRRVAR